MSTTPASALDQTQDPISQPPATTPVGHAGTRVTVTERPASSADGFLAAVVGLGCLAVAVWLVITNWTLLTSPSHSNVALSWAVVLVLVGATILSAIVVVQPGQTKVVQFFGRYVGTVSRPGLTWVRP